MKDTQRLFIKATTNAVFYIAAADFVMYVQVIVS